MTKYETVDTIKLSTDDTILKSRNLPELVHLDDPAYTVMLDFCQIPAFTIKTEATLEDAQNEMEFHGTHFMLVTNDKHHVQGILTSEDLLGEKPIKVIGETRLSHDKILVRMLMTPLEDVPAFDVSAVEKSRVGNIIKTLHKIDSPFALVVRYGDDGEKILRGSFTTAQISKQLHINVRKRIHDIDSISDLTKWKN